MFESWIVGEKAPGAWSKVIGRPDGAILEQSSDGALILALLMQGPSDHEIYMARKGTIESAYYAQPPYWLGIIRFAEDRKLCMDFSFDVSLYPAEERAKRMAALNESQLLLVALIDTTNAKLNAMRVVTMSPEFRESLYLCASDPKPENFSNKYTAWISKVYDKYDYNQLWRESRRTGVFGAQKYTH